VGRTPSPRGALSSALAGLQQPDGGTGSPPQAESLPNQSCHPIMRGSIVERRTQLEQWLDRDLPEWFEGQHNLTYRVTQRERVGSRGRDDITSPRAMGSGAHLPEG
jgi:hypothetical protein